jgi:Fe2+ or Zn2+ uptake regulation protein
MRHLHSFFGAEDLYKRAKQKDKKIGLATIYRFLTEAEKENAVCSYLCNKRMIYSTSTNNHCHFVCQKCHKKEHFSVDKVDFLKKVIPGEICHFQINVGGLCSRCKGAH